MGAVGRPASDRLVAKLKPPATLMATGKVGPASTWPTSAATPLSALLTLPLTVGLVSVVALADGAAYVTTGGAVSSTKVSSNEADTLPALSVAIRCTVWVPSAEPSSGMRC